jgi:hypothetical protein
MSTNTYLFVMMLFFLSTIYTTHAYLEDGGNHYQTFTTDNFIFETIKNVLINLAFTKAINIFVYN